MFRVIRIFQLFLVTAVCGWAITSSAQTTRGDIQGRIVDQTGAALPGVTVSLTSEALIGTQHIVSDANGQYKFLVLPPGDYSLTFTLTGFQTRTRDQVPVNISSTSRIDVIMTEAFTDEVVVTTEAPLVDTSDTTVGVDLTSDFYSGLPTGRNYTSVANVTPGAQADGSGQTFYGSTGAENAYYIDGANTTGVELGQQGTNLNFEFIDEVQVKSGSYNAEYGRATGSVISVITKSGGNEFHGDVFGYYDSDSLQAGLKGEADVGAIGASTKRTSFTRSDFGVDIGGYVVKDRLWFFAAYDYVDNEANQEVLEDFSDYIVDGTTYGEEFPTTTNSDLWALKLTWRISANHSLSGSGFGDPTKNDGVIAGASLAATPLHFTGLVETGGTNYALNYDGIFGQNVVISARAAQHNETNTTTGDGFDVAGWYDYTDPIGDGTRVWGWDADGNAHQRTAGLGFFQNQEFSRDQYNADLSWFVGNFAGTHEFKVGYEFEDIGVKNDNYYSGGQVIYRYTCVQSATRDCQGQPYYFNHRFYVPDTSVPPDELTASDVNYPLTVDTKSENDAWYIQDTWQVTSNLSLAIGIRSGGQKLFNGNGEVQQDITDEWAPRLGFVWDFLGNGKSKLFGHWGYFYETIPMDIVIRSYGGEISIFSYNLSDDPNDVANDPTVRPARYLGGGFSRVDPGTKGQYIEEYIVGAEYEFAPGWAVGAKYISRDLPRIIEDALALDGDYFIGNPSLGEMQFTYTQAAAWGYNDAGPTEIVTPSRKFTGYEFTLQKRFSNNYQFITSILFSDLTGNYDGTFQASTGQLDPNLNSAFDYADFQVNNEGKLSNDVPFQFKFDGIYRFNFGLTTGLSAYYRDGKPITAMGYDSAYANWEYYLSERGAFGRVDSQWEADLHFGYPIKLGSSLDLNLMLDIFDVFNNQGEISRNIRYTNTDDTYDVLDWDTNVPYPPIQPGDTDRPPTNEGWNTANHWQNPTTVRLGVRLSF